MSGEWYAEPGRFISMNEFAKTKEAGVGSLLGDGLNSLIPENGDVMSYGDGGAGKTTLGIDQAFHLAAGLDWLEIPVPKPVNVAIIENEGPRPWFRLKLGRKLDWWNESGYPSVDDRLMILEEPWGRFTFDDEGHRLWLARVVDRLDLAMVLVGPITTAGMHEAGTIQETRAFQALLADVRERAARSVAFSLIHHENRAGKVSGAWEGTGDTLVHVTSPSRGFTKLLIQKARWASEYQGQTIKTVWSEGEGFTVMHETVLEDETVEDEILAAVRDNPGCAWGKVEKAVPGVGAERRREVRDRLLREGRLVNVGKVAGELLILTYVQKDTPARLYPPGHPELDNLRPGPRPEP